MHLASDKQLENLEKVEKLDDDEEYSDMEMKVFTPLII